MGWRRPSTSDTLPRVSADLLGPVRSPFHALAVTLVPEIVESSPAEWDAFGRIVTNAIRSRPPRIQRQILLFIRLLDIVALVRYGRRLEALDPTRRTALVEAISKAPVLMLRRGAWGLRTLVMMGYYARPETQRAIGYRADARGWEARR
jgi:hypothetical protein